MVQKTLLVIGAGLAGLSAGCYAQMNGYKSHIFEHHTVAGGVAAAWKRKSYLIDGGIHFLMDAQPGQPLPELYRELGVDGIGIVPLPGYGRVTDEATGNSIEITSDLDRTARELKAISSRDAGAIDHLIAGARAMKGLDMGAMSFSAPPELSGRLGTLKLFWQMRGLLRYFVGKSSLSVAEYIKKAPIHDPWLRYILENLFLPDVPVYFVMMILGLLAGGQMGLLDGGCRDFVGRLLKRYQDLGGQVAFNATVDEILVEHNRAVGVRLADGSKHRADVVVSAADGYSTIFKLLRGRYVNKEIENRYRNWRLTSPSVTCSYGVAQEFKSEPWLQLIKLKEPFSVGPRMVSGFAVRIFNYSAKFAPKGRSVIQALFDTEWDWWNTLQRDKPRYEAERKRVAAECLQRLETHYPGIRKRVEVTDVATPYTYWRYTLNWQGSPMGWLPVPEVLTKLIRRTLPGLDNFYMAGQWVTPGGSVPGCLYTGRHVVQILCRRAKLPFVTKMP